LLLLNGVTIITPIPVDADMADVYTFDDGGTFHNGTDLHMPQANVSIEFNHAHNGDVISVSCDFEIYTSISQNTTLAFVYPNSWDWSSNSDATIWYSIIKNGDVLNFTTYSWEELGWNASDYSQFEPYDDWLSDALFSVFDVELIGNASTLISVEMNAWDFPWSNYFDFHYIVGSARTFTSDTHERIHVRIIENQPLYGINFGPNISLTVEENGIYTDAYWDFNVSDFEYDTIGFGAYINEYHPNIPSPSTPTPTLPSGFIPWILTTVGIVSVFLVVWIILFRRYKKM